VIKKIPGTQASSPQITGKYRLSVCDPAKPEGFAITSYERLHKSEILMALNQSTISNAQKLTLT